MPTSNGVPIVELTVDDLVARARELSSRPGRTVLGVTGPPGAGKSTITHALDQALAAQAVIVPMDGFHLSNELLVEMGRRDRKGAPDTYDVAGYISLLRRIREREQGVYAPRFDREIEQSIGSAQLVPADVPLVVTEGNYLLTTTDGWLDVREHLDEVWYLDVPTAELRRRLIKRRMGHGHPHDSAQDWVDSVDLPNATVVIESRDRADLVVQLVPTPDPQAVPAPPGKVTQ